MPNLEALSIICSLVEIVGLFLIVGWKWLPQYTGALISVGGFATMVKVFLPLPGHQSMLTVIAAFCGCVVIVMGCQKAQGKAF